MISTTEATRCPGVTPRRAVALVASGELETNKIGHSWAIDEWSVVLRQSTPKLKGRPPLGDCGTANYETHTLMNANHKVARFTYNRASRQVTKVENLEDYAWAPLGACVFSGKVGRFNLND